MTIVLEYARQYPFVLAGVVLLLLFLCWKSEDVREWVIRLIVLALVVVALYFAFQKFKYLLPSSSRPPAISDDSLEPEEHAGKKYYKTPDERFEEQQK